ncbi:hypothetical protein L596_019738 [Steinernema carpocapsae]|uniref:Uncharacterized protein n=1 Tax=Steinernema carpocapsae TaxID=34508 RepID=A0A4U5MRK6_STECR|nr:hypothetical protein L596_019738 [Steinernema carpocapsae]
MPHVRSDATRSSVRISDASPHLLCSLKLTRTIAMKLTLIAVTVLFGTVFCKEKCEDCPRKVGTMVKCLQTALKRATGIEELVKDECAVGSITVNNEAAHTCRIGLRVISHLVDKCLAGGEDPRDADMSENSSNGNRRPRFPLSYQD